jgi:hypothetical protein
MTDLVTTAKTARERLAVGLNALQAPDAPEPLMSAAEAIAATMSALHRIERTGTVAAGEAGVSVLDLARQALGQLQAQTVEHPALDQAMEAVAESLGLVFGLVQHLSRSATDAAPPPEPQPVAVPVTAASPAAPAAPVSTQRAAGAQVRVVSVARPAKPEQTGPRPQVAAPSPAAAVRPADTGEVSAHKQFVEARTEVAQQGASRATAQSPAAAAPAPITVSGGPPLQCVEAALGAHSPTNFYKGLSGNDVVDHGGIFIATYQIPPVGHQLLIKVALPGGYEFEAKGVVRWTREASPSGGEDTVSPGFGAQFTEISNEGRQLVYRYVRNREPLLHDDL